MFRNKWLAVLADSIILKLREELKPLNVEILGHRAVTSPNAETVRSFVLNQMYIVPHDLKALSVLLSRASEDSEIRFFKTLVDGDFAGYNALKTLADELKVNFELSRVSLSGAGYTHFLSWLALHASLGEASVALLVNLPVWGANLQKLKAWAVSSGMVKNTEFFRLFEGPFDALEDQAGPTLKRHLNWERYRFVAAAIQHYELDFWNAVAAAAAP